MSSAKKNVLLLGMFYSNEERFDQPGQSDRDRIRCKALEDRGYTVFTLDDKHLSLKSVQYDNIPSHCQGNFNDPKRLMKTIRQVWGSLIKFDVVCLDYFFSPQGWAGDRWTEKFFTRTLPSLVTENLLNTRATIWLPHIQHVQDMVHQNKASIDMFYDIVQINDPTLSPLYLATEDSSIELGKCLDYVTNEGQLPQLLIASNNPFIRLTYKLKGALSLTSGKCSSIREKSSKRTHELNDENKPPQRNHRRQRVTE
jgi:hypothetical protein